jgi:hypothetical protein
MSDLGTAIGSGVSSVNTLVGAVVLDTDDIQELVSPTNKWFTDTRARAAISAGTGISYNSGTGVITNAVTSGQIATALGYTPADGANYLPLAGGTMGGAIFGTIATFASSTSVTALGITLSGATGDGVKITHSAGRAFNIQSSGSGFGILINNETASTSAPFTIQKQGLDKITFTDGGAGTFSGLLSGVNASFTSSGSADTVGINHSSGSGIALNITKGGNGEGIYVNKSSGSGNAVTIVGTLNATTLVKNGGTSSQFLKADGSVDSSTYALDSDVVKLTGNQTINGVKTFDAAVIINSSLNIVSGFYSIINNPGNTAYWQTYVDSSNLFIFGYQGTTPKVTINSSGNLTANSFIKSGGTSSQFLKADGSIDSTAYLPLSGGTLSGALNGTSAVFSSSVTASALYVTGMTSGSGAVYYSGTRLNFANNNASGTLGFIINGGSTAMTLNTDASASFVYNVGISGALSVSSTTSLSGALSGTSATFTGNVGIGTTSLFTRFTSATTNTRLEFDEVNSTTAYLEVLNSGRSATNYFNIYNRGLNVFTRAGGSGASYVQSFTLTDSGNVGIGTTAPGALLQVGGSGASAVSTPTSILMDGTYRTGGATFDSLKFYLFKSATESYGFGLGDLGDLQYWAGTTSTGTHRFFTSQTERMRITSGGDLYLNQTTNDAAAGGARFQLTQGNGNWIHSIRNSNTSGGVFGSNIVFSYAPNNTGSAFFAGGDTGGERYRMYANGGLANYQSNNVNLSDERTKKEISPLESYWNKFKALEIVKFKYKDQTHDDFNIGVIAQQVESVAPEFVDVDGWGETRNDETPLKSIYTADLYHASIGVLKEAMAKIETLEAEIQTLKNK